jgi:hypothetical protein
MNLRDVTMKHGRLIVFLYVTISQKYGDLIKYELTPVIGTQKNMASTGVFVLVVFALKHFISGHGRQPSTILT